MSETVATVHTVADLRAQVSAWRAAGLRVALVPTMGALHAGHLALVERAGTLADRVVVSIFVNPTQFGAGEDFDTYPRTLDTDRARLATLGAAPMVFAPAVSEMYPDGFATSVSVEGPSRGLCGDARPGHFQGVATVVTKLLLQCLPDVAVFGEKDYQQLQVIRRLARDLDIPVRIDGAPTVREADGLAMSSRNAYLGSAERAVASRLHAAMQAAAAAMRTGTPVAEALATARADVLAAGFSRFDYLDLRDASSLVPLEALDSPARLIAAAFLGKTRLIDNIAVDPAE